MDQMCHNLVDLVETRIDYFREQNLFGYQSQLALRLLICIKCHCAKPNEYQELMDQLCFELKNEQTRLDKSAHRLMKYYID